MSDSAEEYILRVMSGRQRGPIASLLRGVMATAEPVYRGIIALRNRKFDTGYGVRKLPRPVISVGNITSGGTGKTPVVRWLCENLRAAGMDPAVLMRGYKSRAGLSDERRMLEEMLNIRGKVPLVIRANPDRIAGGTDVLREHPHVDAFVLDDGFQHRQLARDFDLVLISATEPFGFGHVHPRGLLRESPAGLRRADALLITHADQVDAAALAVIETQIRRYTTAPIYHASHVHTGLRSANSFHAIDELTGKRFFAFCGIGDPAGFFRQIEARAGKLAGSRSFSDHHTYSESDVVELDAAAVAVGSQLMVTTQKDWIKLANLSATAVTKTPIGAVEMTVQFRDADERRLLEQLTVAASPPVASSVG